MPRTARVGLLLLACSPPPAPIALAPWTEPPVAHGSAPRLTADGGAFVFYDFLGPRTALFRGRTNDDADPVPVATLDAPAVWWDLRPDGSSVLLVDRAHHLLDIPLDPGPPRVLGMLAGEPTWVEPRWSEGLVLAAVPRDGGIEVRAWPLAGGGPSVVFADPIADDVVFDAALRPRLRLDRAEKEHATANRYAELQVLDPDGGPLGAPFWQPWWVVDRAPFPRVGDGPVHLLAMAYGETRVSLGTVDERGFAPVWTPAWGDGVRWLPDRRDGAIDGVGEAAERLRWTATRATDDVATLVALGQALDSDLRVVSRTPDDRLWVIERWSGSELLRTEIVDRETGRRRAVGRTWWGDDAVRRPVRAEVATARDGLPLAVYLTTPDPARYGPGPWPLVVWVHGGPWSGRHDLAVDPEAQRAAERGYASLAVNFRGSRGFGWDVMATAQYGGAMIDDLHDGIDWALARGVADPDRIAMVGASFGGDAALRFATEPVPRVRCAVAGLTYGNLTTEGSNLRVEAVGPLAWREARSPDRFTENLQGPVLIWSGGRDGRRPEAVGDFVRRAEGHGKDVTWLWFPEEGHGLQDPGNRRALDTVIDRFLGACLGGPAWPLHPGVDGGVFEVRAGRVE